MKQAPSDFLNLNPHPNGPDPAAGMPYIPS